MGCSAAKNLTVEPDDTDRKLVTNITNGHVVKPAQKIIDIAETANLENVNNVQQGTNGLSFEIAFQEETEAESIIKKHPPKRFQKLEDQQLTSPEATLEKLQEKLEEAEIRRQQILQQRVQSAKHRQNLLRKQQSVDEDDDEQHLKVPQEDIRPPNPYDVSYI